MGILNDHDPVETQEWIDSLRAVVQHQGTERARWLLGRLRDEALQAGTMPPFLTTTPYRNTIPPDQEEKSPGDRELEHKIRAAIRWNAVAIILRANKESSELGGHIASFQSSAMLYDVGFNHFWHAPGRGARRRPDLHPGARLAGHLCARLPRGPAHREQLLNFRQESRRRRPLVVPAPVADAGLLAVPHGVDGPRAADGDLPGALHASTWKTAAWPKTDDRKVWAFLGDGEMRRARIAGRDLARPGARSSTT